MAPSTPQGTFGAELLDPDLVAVRPGVPDVIAIRRGQVYAMELKRGGGRATDAQLQAIEDIRAAGGHAQVCYGLDHALAVLEG